MLLGNEMVVLEAGDTNAGDSEKSEITNLSQRTGEVTTLIPSVLLSFTLSFSFSRNSYSSLIILFFELDN
jgi:hypothetical protein